MHISSEAIRRVVEIAAEDGNRPKVVSEDWRPKQIVFMAEPLSASAKARIAEELPQLRHFQSKATPHDPPDEGYVCAVDDVVISFPIAGAALRWY